MREVRNGCSGTGCFSGLHEPGHSLGTDTPKFHNIPRTPSVLGQQRGGGHSLLSSQMTIWLCCLEKESGTHICNVHLADR